MKTFKDGSDNECKILNATKQLKNTKGEDRVSIMVSLRLLYEEPMERMGRGVKTENLVMRASRILG